MIIRKMIIFMLFAVTFNCKAERLDEHNSNYSFSGNEYTIYIKSNCPDSLICDKLTGHFINKTKKEDFYLNNGITINIGYDNNLRGFVFTDKNIEYIIRQPSEENIGESDKWILIIHKKGTDYIDSEVNKALFSEVGDIEFLSSVSG